MADDLQSVAETTAPADAATVETPSPSPAESSSSPDFGSNLRAAMGQPSETAAPAATFTQADLDAKIAEIQGKYSWVGDLNQDRLQQLTGYEQAIINAQQDPMGAVTELIARSLAAGGEHRKKALAFASQLLRNQRGQNQPQAEQPTAKREVKPIPATGVNGESLELYTAQDVKQLLDDLKAELTGQIQPIQQAHQTAEERAAQYERDRQTINFANDIYAKMAVKPGFKENQDAIRDAWAKMPGNDDPYTARENLRDAYDAVVYPKMQTTSTSAAASDNARRQAASTGRVVTQQPTQASPPAALSFSQKIAAEMNKRRTGT